MEIRSWHAKGFAIEEKPRFHRASWRTQRIAWSVLGLMLLAALLGLLGGGGPLAKGKAGGGPDDITVEHERFPRYSAPSKPCACVFPSMRRDRGKSACAPIAAISATCASSRSRRRPARVEAGADELVYVFAAATSRPTEVVFRLHMETIGPVAGAFALDARAPVRFSQFVFP